jgi:hypothetical protein
MTMPNGIFSIGRDVLFDAISRDDGSDTTRSSGYVRLAGNALFLLVTVWLIQFVFFLVLGMGGVIGIGHNLSFLPGERDAKLRGLQWGSSVLPLKAGQAVRVTYEGQIPTGEVSLYLVRKWPTLLMGQSSGIQGNTAGTIDLVAPEDGWYAVNVRPRMDYKDRQAKRREGSLPGPLTPRISQAMSITIRWSALAT